MLLLKGGDHWCKGRTGTTFFDASLLLAEDDPLNADIASRTLKKMGCRVAVAPDGLAAARMWEEGDFDLILMDCEMAEMDGFEASRRIRERERQANRITHADRGAERACARRDQGALPGRGHGRCAGQAVPRSAAQGHAALPGLREEIRPLQEESESEASRNRRARSRADRQRAGQGQRVPGWKRTGSCLKISVARFADTARTQLTLLRKSQIRRRERGNKAHRPYLEIQLGSPGRKMRLAVLRGNRAARQPGRASRCCPPSFRPWKRNYPQRCDQLAGDRRRARGVASSCPPATLRPLS